MKLRRESFHTVRKYDKILDENLCENLIQDFESKSEFHELVENQGKPNFVQLNLNQYYPEIIDSLLARIKVCLDIYKMDLLDVAKYLPPLKKMEQFRLKKYEPGGHDRFDEHIDVADLNSSRRYLAFLFYLNDVEVGGETEFPFHDIMVKPKTGSVLIFPPIWEYPHTGLPPKSGSKYIMSTYLHYG